MMNRKSTSADAMDLELHQPIYPSVNSSKPTLNTAILVTLIALIIIVIGLAAVVTILLLNRDSSGHQNPVPTDPTSLPAYITLDSLYTHLRALWTIALNNKMTRAVGTSGYNATVDYVYNTLTSQTDYSVMKQYLEVPYFQLASTPLLQVESKDGNVTSFVYYQDFLALTYTGPANFQNIGAVAVNGLGCSKDDYGGDISGKIAIVKRGFCTFANKTAIAESVGAAAILIWNDGSPANGRGVVQNRITPYSNIAALSITTDLGGLLSAAADEIKLTLFVESSTAPTSVANVCADTKRGDPTRTIVIGSHIDSVPAGAGINDDGSGTSANLAMALGAYQVLSTTSVSYPNRIKFCFWAAEELGLLGSTYHVQQSRLATTPGSPNAFYGIYNGSNPPVETPASARKGSIVADSLFVSHFESHSKPYDHRDFDARSDYQAFLLAGIVCGGVSSGADKIKTQEQRDRYTAALGAGKGGIPNLQFDPCYHQPCDTIENINPTAILDLSTAAASVVEILASQSDLRGFLQYPTEDEVRKEREGLNERLEALQLSHFRS